MRRARADVADQLLAPQDDQAAIQIEERKPGAGHKLGFVAGVAEEEFNVAVLPMSSMSNIRIESRHRPAGSGQYEATTFVHVGSSVF